ncbi:hypothetical protein EVAR_19489_1 [Eumeta japonica]|uniref:Uncharacterized protein n=1 Tax=Eumeta variegata TaxID=151549 RepID=A0A4C1V8Q4_EUMVA|nr:hypothetical protein EVAR_19489_1 [Eumeta japonica]
MTLAGCSRRCRANHWSFVLHRTYARAYFKLDPVRVFRLELNEPLRSEVSALIRLHVISLLATVWVARRRAAETRLSIFSEHAHDACLCSSVYRPSPQTPPRVETEPFKEATREPHKLATAKQTVNLCRSTRRRHSHHYVHAASGQKPEFAQLATDFRKARSGEDRLMVIICQ